MVIEHTNKFESLMKRTFKENEIDDQFNKTSNELLKQAMDNFLQAINDIKISGWSVSKETNDFESRIN